MHLRTYYARFSASIIGSPLVSGGVSAVLCCAVVCCAVLWCGMWCGVLWCGVVCVVDDVVW